MNPPRNSSSKQSNKDAKKSNTKEPIITIDLSNLTPEVYKKDPLAELRQELEGNLLRESQDSVSSNRSLMDLKNIKNLIYGKHGLITFFEKLFMGIPLR